MARIAGGGGRGRQLASACGPAGSGHRCQLSAARAASRGTYCVLPGVQTLTALSVHGRLSTHRRKARASFVVQLQPSHNRRLGRPTWLPLHVASAASMLAIGNYETVLPTDSGTSAACCPGTRHHSPAHLLPQLCRQSHLPVGNAGPGLGGVQSGPTNPGSSAEQVMGCP